MFLLKISKNTKMLCIATTKSPTKKCNNPITAYCSAVAYQHPKIVFFHPRRRAKISIFIPNYSAIIIIFAPTTP